MHGHFAFICVRTVYHSFYASGIKLCTPGCMPFSTGLAYTCKCKVSAHKSTCYCFFRKDKTTTHLTHNMQVFMCYSCVQHRKPAVTGHSNVQHLDQYSRQRHVATFQGHLVCHVLHVPTHAQKGFNLNFDFSRNVMGLLRQELNFISM